ncbi:hypothetical protein WGA77_33160 [Nocardia seriolae]|uniref:hypothetical protein n=1 Tax=Nocardia seriolae TaxID=37332 RepID=UPI0004B007CA|nr:hypothetical protein [Nocardia seriolae]
MVLGSFGRCGLHLLRRNSGPDCQVRHSVLPGLTFRAAASSELRNAFSRAGVPDMTKIGIILGSTRPDRNGE